MPHTFIQPEGWVPPKGYSNGVVASGKTLFTGGVVGWDPTKAIATFPETFEAQFAQALSNVMAIVKTAGGQADDLVRMTVYVTDKRQYLGALKAIGASWKQHLGRHYPAMALVQVAALVEDAAKVEIEATAVLEERSTP
jgi:enamine deaminase RidA (YjgF/YER057c/UK114 family)